MNDYEITKMRYWVQKVLPLVYDDSLSYYELLGKIAAKINEMVDLTNEIPTLVENAVAEGITDERIAGIISRVMSEYFWVNVKLPPSGVTPAKGDGTTDDTTAITDAINYAISHEMAVFIPAGRYRISQLNFNDINGVVSIIGCGRTSSVIYSTYVGGDDVIVFDGDITGLNINGVGFIGSGSYSSTTNAMVLISTDGDNDYININDVMVYNGPRGIEIVDGENVTMSNVDVYNPDNDGVVFSMCNNVRGNNITVGTVTDNNAYALYFDTSHDVVINNAILSTNSGVDVYAGTATNHIYVQFKSSEKPNVTPYTDNGSNNDFDVLFIDRDWTRAIDDAVETIRGELNIIADNLTTETTARENADTTIEGLITAETTARENADTTIEGLITAEATARENADTAIYTYVDNAITDIDIGDVNTRLSTLESDIETINDRLYNVKDFGAAGDGVTDDTNAIRACIDQIVADSTDGDKNMAWAVFPPGQYVITGQINIPHGCGIRGTMPLETIHVYDNHTPTPGSWLFIKDNAPVPVYDFNTQDASNTYGTIILNHGSVVTDIGIYYPEQTDSIITNGTVKPYRYTFEIHYGTHEFAICRVMAANPYSLIYMDRAVQKGHIHHVYGTPLKHGITMIREADIVRIHDIHFHGNIYSRGDSDGAVVVANFRYANLVAFNFTGCDWPVLQNAFVYGCYRGIELGTCVKDIDSGGWSGTRYGLFLDVGIEHCSGTPVIDTASSDDFATYYAANGHRGNTFMRCIFDSASYGVAIGYGHAWSFISCAFRTSSHGAYLYRGSGNCLIDSVTFTGCYFNKTGGASASSNVGAIVSGAKTLTVTGCMFLSGLTANTYIKGIRLYSPCAAATITGNTFHDYSSYCIDIENASVKQIYFINNVFENCTAADIAYINANAAEKGVIQTGNGSTVRVIDHVALENTDVIQYTPAAKPTHISGKVELYVDTAGNLCYTTTNNVKRTLSYT